MPKLELNKRSVQFEHIKLEVIRRFRYDFNVENDDWTAYAKNYALAVRLLKINCPLANKQVVTNLRAFKHSTTSDIVVLIGTFI